MYVTGELLAPGTNLKRIYLLRSYRDLQICLTLQGYIIILVQFLEALLAGCNNSCVDAKLFLDVNIVMYIMMTWLYIMITKPWQLV